jgi:hypothetical protein
MIEDLSDRGARLKIDPAIELPPEFLLLLSRHVSRRCQLVWRRDGEAGVKFRGETS